MRTSIKAIAPIALAVLLALLPAPEGLAPHAWYFTAIFAGVVLALVLEPIPGALIGLVGVTAVALLSPWVLYAPEQLARPGFNPASASLSWALSGFANGTVWLIFAAFMFALGYDRSGLGRRIALLLVQRLGRRTLTLGYAVAAGGPRAGALHPVQHRALRRHDLPDRSATCRRSTTASRTIPRRGASAAT